MAQKVFSVIFSWLLDDGSIKQSEELKEDDTLVGYGWAGESKEAMIARYQLCVMRRQSSYRPFVKQSESGAAEIACAADT